ncbi:hypothetical protein [uncultured Treponema sp.]|uniref:hypothetical protein n=1 Tax=uncultured Treponema sp. TaxID=162155 RepID=UPI0025DB98A2|nr:hypothetical protein [uncultured Treponema sp.]
MATSSLSKTFYIDSKKEAKAFVSMLANSSSNAAYNSTVRANQISKERMAAIISKKLNGNNQ